jgi:hypothetical protein
MCLERRRSAIIGGAMSSRMRLAPPARAIGHPIDFKEGAPVSGIELELARR